MSQVTGINEASPNPAHRSHMVVVSVCFFVI